MADIDAERSFWNCGMSRLDTPLFACGVMSVGSMWAGGIIQFAYITGAINFPPAYPPPSQDVLLREAILPSFGIFVASMQIIMVTKLLSERWEAIHCFALFTTQLFYAVVSLLSGPGAFLMTLGSSQSVLCNIAHIVLTRYTTATSLHRAPRARRFSYSDAEGGPQRSTTDTEETLLVTDVS